MLWGWRKMFFWYSNIFSQCSWWKLFQHQFFLWASPNTEWERTRNLWPRSLLTMLSSASPLHKNSPEKKWSDLEIRTLNIESCPCCCFFLASWETIGKKIFVHLLSVLTQLKIWFFKVSNFVKSWNEPGQCREQSSVSQRFYMCW